MNESKPIVFGDPAQPLTVGEFVSWLEGPFEEHRLEEVGTRADVSAIKQALTGDGNGSPGIECRVNEMWKTSQRVDAVLSVGKWIWAATFGLLGAAALVAAIGHNVGWW